MKVSLLLALLAAVLLAASVQATTLQDQLDISALADAESLSSATNGLFSHDSLVSEADDEDDEDVDESDDDGGDDDNEDEEEGKDQENDEVLDDAAKATGLSVAQNVRRFSAKRLTPDQQMLSPAFQMAHIQAQATAKTVSGSSKSKGPTIVPPFLEGEGCRSAKIVPHISASSAKGTKGKFILSFKSFSAPKTGSSWCSAVTQIAHVPAKGCTIVSSASITAVPNLSKKQSGNMTHSVFYALYPNPPGVQSRVQRFSGPDKKSSSFEMVKVNVSPSVNSTEPVIVFVANRITIGANVAGGLSVSEMKFKIDVTCK